jgi:Protein of unknown function DUF111
LHLHLNLAAGLTGDMFIAAVLDAFPRFEQRVLAAIDALDSPYPVVCSLVAHADHEVTGHRFKIEPFDKYLGYIPFAFSQERAGESVRERLITAEIPSGVRTHATKIFDLLAKAESAMHGIVPETMALERAAWNSTAQVAGAAVLIDALEPTRWTASPFPPVEAVTLTGAAIVDYLCPMPSRLRGQPLPSVRSLARSGTGFGDLTSQHSYMRLLCFEEGDAALAGQNDPTHTPRHAPRGAGDRPRQ